MGRPLAFRAIAHTYTSVDRTTRSPASGDLRPAGVTDGPFHVKHGWPCRGSARHPPTTARTAMFHVKRGRRGRRAGGGSSRFLRVGRLARGSIGLPGPAAGYPAAGRGARAVGIGVDGVVGLVTRRAP